MLNEATGRRRSGRCVASRRHGNGYPQGTIDSVSLSGEARRETNLISQSRRRPEDGEKIVTGVDTWVNSSQTCHLTSSRHQPPHPISHQTTLSHLTSIRIITSHSTSPNCTQTHLTLPNTLVFNLIPHHTTPYRLTSVRLIVPHFVPLHPILLHSFRTILIPSHFNPSYYTHSYHFIPFLSHSINFVNCQTFSVNLYLSVCWSACLSVVGLPV